MEACRESLRADSSASLTRINKGRVFYTRPDRLGEYLLVNYLSQQRKKV